MFEQATRLKLRFNYRGQITTEDLWGLRLTALDEIYQALRREQRDTVGESLLGVSKGNDELSLKIDIVRHIVMVKLAEKAANEQRAENAAKKQRILAIIENKQDAALQEKSVDELMALVNSLG